MGTVPVRRKKRAEAADSPQVFRSPTAVIIWWVWLLFAAANLVDLAVQGRDHLSVVAAAILVLVTGIAYVTAQRPRVIADRVGITIVNPLRDYHIGWAGVTQVDLADMLRVHCRRGLGDTKIINSWAVHYSRRRKAAAEFSLRRTAARATSGRRSSFGTFGNFGLESSRRNPGYGSAADGEPASSAEAEAERIARVLGEYATAARAETVWAVGTVEIAGAPDTAEVPAVAEPADATRVADWLEPLKSTWNQTALLALLVPALILLIVALV